MPGEPPTFRPPLDAPPGAVVEADDGPAEPNAEDRPTLRGAKALDVGMVFVNRDGCYDFASPFGRFETSGWGKELGLASMKARTRETSILLDVEPAP